MEGLILAITTLTDNLKPPTKDGQTTTNTHLGNINTNLEKVSTGTQTMAENIASMTEQTKAMAENISSLELTMRRQYNQIQRIGDAQYEQAKAAYKENGTFNDFTVAMLDGTEETYKSVQKAWFKSNGALSLKGTTVDADAISLTSLVDEWYKATREVVSDWDGWVRFYHPGVSQVSTGTKMGSLTGMECTPSTTETANKDDFAGHPLFAVTVCNWKMSEKKPIITAIKGISTDFEQDNPDKFVGVLQMSGYHHWTEMDESSQHYDDGYSATYNFKYSHIEPLPESVNADGTMREWVLHGKYMAGKKDDGSYTCCSGITPAWQKMSHNDINTETTTMGNGISGNCSCDVAFLKLMARLKYGSLTLDGIMNGCLNLYFDGIAQIAETGVKRIIVPANKLNSIVVGAYCRIIPWDGVTLYSKDAFGKEYDNTASLLRSKHLDSLVAEDSVQVTAVEKVTIDDTDYTAVYVDTADTFDTSVSDGNITRLYSWPYSSGTTDEVKGNDGAINCTSAQYPIMLQGIEFECGQYSTLTDVIIKQWLDDNDSSIGYIQPYIVKDTDKRSTAITENYQACNIKMTQISEGYIKHEKYNNGLYFPDLLGGSSSTYTKDCYWQGKSVKDGKYVPYAGTYEVLCHGYLGYGVSGGGLSFLGGTGWLGGSNWDIGSRLSPNGTRGEWTAS